jgi:hypothetical protein
VAFLLAGPPACAGTVRLGTSLFFPAGNVECSDLEADPFHGADAAARDSCAKGWLDFLLTGALAVEIDGEPVHNVTNYLAASGDFDFTVGPDNVFGIACSGACSGKASGYGYYLMLAPLPPGTHTIHIVAAAAGIDTTWTLTVR